MLPMSFVNTLLNTILLIGSYSSHETNALRMYDFNTETGDAKLIAVMPVADASYATLGANGMLYAVTESDTEHSYVTAIKLSEKNAEIIGSVKACGNSPCHIAVSPTGEFLATANYGDGSVSIFPILQNGAPGELCQQLHFEGHSVHERRQASSHPHCISFSKDGKYMYVNDLGLDCIHKFKLAKNRNNFVSNTSEKRITLKPGSGPRHIVFSKDNTHAYLINEISDEIAVLTVKGSNMSVLDYYSSPQAGGMGAGDIQISPDGKRLYGSLRLKNDGISQFSILQNGDKLAFETHTPTGTHPRTFTLSGDGKWLLAACRDANAVEIYSLDPTTGVPVYHSKISCDRPALVKFLEF